MPGFPFPAPPIPILSWIVKYGIGAIMIAMFIRAIASWARVDERVGFIRFLARITDPFISPWRRLSSRLNVAFIDFSFFLAWFALSTVSILLLQSIPFGW